ncbi:MAG: SDR family oxidoreductase [Verrucomicrobia bacterium]|jgi:gluconate 5-dehydrogenase|nr:SDR family oxidoreductase [Verrucomicrobiota bacterium]
MKFSESFSTPFRLDREVAIITGGATGLGFGMARSFVASGAKVVLAGRREDELKKAVAALGPAASYVRHDVTEHAKAGELVAVATRAAGAPPSILINNAGVHLKKPAVETSPEEFLTVLNTHVIGAHALTQAVLPGMIQRKQGSVIFIASIASLLGVPKVVAYAAAKSAYVGMVRTLAAEVSADNVRVNAIAPGWIDSEMMRKALAGDPARRDKILGRTPMGKFGDAADIGWAAVYLCSPAAKFVTGVVLPVDGGVSIGF